MPRKRRNTETAPEAAVAEPVIEAEAAPEAPALIDGFHYQVRKTDGSAVYGEAIGNGVISLWSEGKPNKGEYTVKPTDEVMEIERERAFELSHALMN